MKSFAKSIFFYFLLFFSGKSMAQVAETIFVPNIKTVQLFEYGNQQGLPVYTINGGAKLELDFDDLDGDYKNYYYTYILTDGIPTGVTGQGYFVGSSRDVGIRTSILLLTLLFLLIEIFQVAYLRFVYFADFWKIGRAHV